MLNEGLKGLKGVKGVLSKLSSRGGRVRTMAAVLAIGVFALCGCQFNDENIKLGTGGKGGSYYNYGISLSEMLDENTAGYNIEVMETAGSAANLRLLKDGFLDMAIVQSDSLKEAMKDEDAYKGTVCKYKSLASLYVESVQIVVNADSDIESIEDLSGKRVSIGAKDSGVINNAMDILNAYGMDLGKIVESYMSFAESADALLNDEIDAFFVTAGYPTTAISELAEKMSIRLVPIDDFAIRRIIALNDAYTVTIISDGAYEGVNVKTPSIGVNALLVANSECSTGKIDAIMGLLSKEGVGDNLKELSFGSPIREEVKKIQFEAHFDMYMTLAFAVLVLYLGMLLRGKIKFLETFCIPAPVVGGLVFAVLSCLLYAFGIAEFSFDETLKTVCMVMFFTSVGFQANLKVLKSGGISLVVFLGLVTLLIVTQNGMAIGLAKLLNIDPLIGLCTGSIPMVGGHGTAGAFGQVLEDLNLTGATTLCTAAATFGLIAGSLLGGPIGRRLIHKHNLLETAVVEDDSVLVEDEEKHKRSVSMYAPAAYQLAIAMGIGTIISMLLSKTGLTFPIYIGAMIAAAVMRNVGEFSGKYTVHMGEINDIGGICLSLFLGIAMVTLKLWQLADLALPLIILLVCQTLFMALFAYFVVYNLMGRDYDAAILAAGTCGFGMGATPNAMANMQALTDKYAASVKAYLLVPIVGSMFADFINSIVITFFINMI